MFRILLASLFAVGLAVTSLGCGAEPEVEAPPVEDVEDDDLPGLDDELEL